MLSSPAIATDIPTCSSPLVLADPHPEFRDTHDGSRPSDRGTTEFDAASHEGLRHSLEAVAGQGWEGAAGHAIVAALQQRAGSWAFLADRRCGRPRGSTDPADVIAIAWLTLEKFATKTAEAQRPWAYLWTAVGNELARVAIAESQLTDPARVRGASHERNAVVRVGLDSAILDGGLAAPSAED